MSLVLACVVRIMHDNWSIRLGENRPDRALKHLAAMLYTEHIKTINFQGMYRGHRGTCEVPRLLLQL